MVQLRDLRSVAAVAEELHFGRAAARLGVAPSTLSRRVAAVERELGVTLFVRTSRRVGLTQAGRELATRLPAALRQLDGVLAAVQAGGHGADGGWEI
ncbi:MAG: LysR family transcriptional regulator [Solirubrobacteraceae bacterium]